MKLYGVGAKQEAMHQLGFMRVERLVEFWRNVDFGTRDYLWGGP